MKFSDVLLCFLVGALWGTTNPFLKKAADSGGTKARLSKDRRWITEGLKVWWEELYYTVLNFEV
jgi:hypothetical protein